MLKTGEIWAAVINGSCKANIINNSKSSDEGNGEKHFGKHSSVRRNVHDNEVYMDYKVHWMKLSEASVGSPLKCVVAGLFKSSQVKNGKYRVKTELMAEMAR